MVVRLMQGLCTSARSVAEDADRDLLHRFSCIEGTAPQGIALLEGLGPTAGVGLVDA